MKCSIIIIMQIIACMISCAERDQMRQQTLKNLAMTDWGNTEVFVQIDSAETSCKQYRQQRTAVLALTNCLTSKGDYILFLENDLEFNRSIRHNLQEWWPVKNQR